MLRPYRHQNLWQGCVGAWCPSQAHSGGTLIDYSNRNNHGTLTNMDPATDWITSGGGWALDFDGTDDFVLVSSNFSITNFPFSFGGWVRVGNLAPTKAIFSFCQYVPSSDQYCTLETRSSQWSIVSRAGSFANAAAGTPVVGEWAHVFGVFESTTSKKLYVNSENIASLTSSLSMPSGIDRFVIGKLRNDSADPHNGQLDDIRFYNRALTDAEIRLLATRRGIAYERKPRMWAVKAPAASGAFTLTANTGTFNEIGQDALLEKGFVVTGEVGAFNETGQDALLEKGFLVVSDVGAFNESGQAANLLKGYRIACDAGTFSLSGQDATLTKTSANSLAADAASFALVGQDATLRVARLLSGDATSFVFTGQDASLSKGRTLTAEAGSYNEAGQDALLMRAARLAIDAASFTFTGQNAQLTFAGGGLVPAPYYYQIMMGG